jgi:hypothetical protein
MICLIGRFTKDECFDVTDCARNFGFSRKGQGYFVDIGGANHAALSFPSKICYNQPFKPFPASPLAF